MKKILALLIALAILMSGAMIASADELEMSDVANMTAPGVLPIVTEPVTITFSFAPNATVSDFYDNDWTHWLQDNTGITIDFFFLPNENPGQKLELMIAANETLPDVIDSNLISNGNLYNYYLDGLVLPMDEYFEKYAYWYNEMMDTYFTEAEVEAMLSICRTFDGATLRFPSTYCDPSNYYNPGSVIWLRDDWLEQWGKGVPANVDELYDFLVFCRDNDVNGNGDASDEIGLVGGIGAIINAFCNYSKWQGSYINVDADGKVFMPQVTENYKKAMLYLNKLAAEGLLSTQAFTADDAQLKVMCIPETPEQAIVAGFQNHPTSFLDNAAQRNSYTPAWPLTSDEYANHFIKSPQFQSSTNAITTACENPEVAFRLLDYTCEYETMIRSRWGTPGVDFEWVEDSTGMICAFPALDYPIVYKAIVNPYADSASKAIWKKDTLTNLPPQLYGGRPGTQSEDPDEIGWSNKNTELLKAVWGMESPEQTETIIFTEDEEMQIADIAASLMSYMDESQTAFILGQMDIESEWDNYIATINSIGYEDYMNVVQVAYDRTMGK